MWCQSLGLIAVIRPVNSSCLCSALGRTRFMQERLKAADGGFLIALVEAGSEMFPVWLDLSPFIKDDWNTCIHNFCVFVHRCQIIS